jgi:hypothetical protein
MSPKNGSTCCMGSRDGSDGLGGSVDDSTNRTDLGKYEGLCKLDNFLGK